MKQATNTSERTLTPESHYEAMINKVVRKEIKEFIIYEWSFEALVEGKPFYFKIGLFQSQMAELLRALGAIETAPGRFDWDDEEVIGHTLSFNLVHFTDKKGVIREQLSDIKLMTSVPKADPKEVQWSE